jgi:hypothetical protein
MHLHVPKPIHGWKQFFNEILVIAIGILIAVAVEQTVEYVHHRHQRAEFEAQMADTFRANERINAESFTALAKTRQYLAALQAAVVARGEGEHVAIPEAPGYTYVTLPTLGPFEAAEADGTLALLPDERIRLYKRLAYQHEISVNDLEYYRQSIRALRAFRKRQDPSPAYDKRLLFITPAADINRLTLQERIEYMSLIATALEAIDQFVVRMKRLDLQYDAVLNGARDESDLVKAITNIH